MSCGVGHSLGLDSTLLWLWYRPVATAPDSTLSLGTSICCRCNPKKQKNNQPKTKTKNPEKKKTKPPPKQTNKKPQNFLTCHMGLCYAVLFNIFTRNRKKISTDCSKQITSYVASQRRSSNQFTVGAE